MSVTMGVNKSPFAGKSGKQLTSRQIRERLDKELETNVALQVKDTPDADKFEVYGRGLLHLTVLMETMRREGFELMVGCPQVIEQVVDGQKMEPFELVDVELPEEASGSVIDMLNQRKGNMLDMGSPTSEGLITIQYEVPTRGMVGVKSRLLSATRGLAVMTTTFAGYRPHVGEFGGRDRGNLLCHEQGEANSFGLMKAQERGVLFSGASRDWKATTRRYPLSTPHSLLPAPPPATGPNDPVYTDQIIGIHARPGDLKVNICKTKQLTNMRAAGKDDNTNLIPPKEMSLEEAVEYIIDDEFVEITPDAIRMGKREKEKDKSGRVKK